MLPPHDLDDEAVLLSRVLWDADERPDKTLGLIAQLANAIEPGAFFSNDNRAIWCAILDCEQRSVVPKMVEVRRVLRDTEAGVPIAYLASIYAQQPYIERIHEVAQRLRKLHLARRAIETCHRAAAHGYGVRAEGVDEYIAALAHRAVELAVTQEAESMVTAHDAVASARSQRQIARRVLVTGLGDLDRVVTLGPGKLIIIGGRPGMGKSLLGVRIAMGVAYAAGGGSAVFSLEMDAEDIVDRLVTAAAGVSLSAYQRGEIDRNRMAVYEDAIGSLRMVIDDQSIVTEAQLSTRLRLAQARCKLLGGTLRVLVVDYLQLIAGDRRLPREQQVASISRTLKVLARQHDICIVAIAQLNRSCESRTPPRPQLSDLRESGAVEQDADAVLFAYRAEYYEGRGIDIKDADRGVCEVIVAKQRSGPTGVARLAFRGEWGLIGNLERDDRHEMDSYDE